MKYHYYAITICVSGKYYALVEKISDDFNLLTALQIPHIVSANACASKKQAEEIVANWRDAWRANGRGL